MSKPSGKPRKVLTGTIHLANSEANELQPKVALYIVDRSFKLIHMSTVGEVGAFEIPTDTVQSAHRILVGPVTEDFDNLEREKLLTLRPADFSQLIERGQLNIARTLWQTWLSFITCVSGTVKRCRRHPSWWYELVQHVRTHPLRRGPCHQSMLDVLSCHCGSVAHWQHWPPPRSQNCYCGRINALSSAKAR